MANTIKIKRSAVSGKVPTTAQLELGELAVNTHDGKLYTKKDDGTAAVVQIGDAASTADALSTARTIALGGDVSGSTSFDGSANVTITATVADDSHNHVISNVDGLQTALDAKLPLSGGQLTGNITFSGAQTVDGRDLSADGSKLDGIESGATADQTASEILTAIKTVDGAGSGLDADTLDGVQGASYAQLASPTFTGTPAAPTAAAGTNTTQIATTAFVSTAVANVVDAAPGALDTLNELAAALGDDANFSTTVTNSIATKLPLSGGQLTGNITFSGSQTVDGRDLSVDGAKLDGIESGATADQTASEILTAIKTVDGSGSGLDADTVDGLNSSSFLRSDANDTATGIITFQSGNDYQIVLNGNSTTWAGIYFTDSGGSDYMYFNGSSGTFSLGGGGSIVAGKKLHVNGGLSVGATASGTSTPTNGIYSQGDISVGGNTVLNAGNYTSYSPSLTGSGASGTWGISITGSAGSVGSTLTRGSYLTGSNFNGSSATTWAVDATTSATASKIVARDGSGHIYGNYGYYSWLNVSHSQGTYTNHTEFYSGTSGWLYKNTASGMRSSLDVPTRTGGDASGTWGIDITGNSATTSQRSFSNDISTTGQGRFTGWYSGGASTGAALEVGYSSGQGYILTYDRGTSAYGITNIAGSACNLKISGSTINVTQGALQQGGNQVLHAGNYTSYSPSLTGSGASGTWGINITGNASGTSGYVASQGNYNTSASTTAASYGTNIRLDFVQAANGWPSYGSVLHWSSYTGGGGGCQFYAPYGSAYGGTQLRYRLADYSNGTNWTSWKTIPDLDATQTFNGANRGQVDALSSASTITPNFNNSNNFSISLSTNTTIANPTNLTAGQSGAIAITYNGGYTVAFGSYWKFPGGTAPTATSTSGKTDVLVYYVESSTRISAQMILNTGG